MGESGSLSSESCSLSDGPHLLFGVHVDYQSVRMDACQHAGANRRKLSANNAFGVRNGLYGVHMDKLKRPTDYESAWNTALAQTLLACRTSAGLTQPGLAEAVGIEKQSVRRYEKEERSIPVPNLLAMIEAMDLTVEDFMALAKVRAEVEMRRKQRDELAARRDKAGLSVPPRNLRAVADSNVGADEEVEGRQEEP